MTLVVGDGGGGGRRCLNGGGRGGESFGEAWKWKFVGMNGWNFGFVKWRRKEARRGTCGS